MGGEVAWVCTVVRSVFVFEFSCFGELMAVDVDEGPVWVGIELFVLVFGLACPAGVDGLDELFSTFCLKGEFWVCFKIVIGDSGHNGVGNGHLG